jgi:hypothetical protein
MDKLSATGVSADTIAAPESPVQGDLTRAVVTRRFSSINAFACGSADACE